jgi:hypothetical protein
LAAGALSLRAGVVLPLRGGGCAREPGANGAGWRMKADARVRLCVCARAIRSACACARVRTCT